MSTNTKDKYTSEIYVHSFSYMHNKKIGRLGGSSARG